MKQADVTIGGEYRVKIGSRMAAVTVIRQIDGRGRMRFECRTGDTGRKLTATAARLRPVPSTAVRAMVDRMVDRMVADALAADDDAITIGGGDAPAIDLAAWSCCPVGAY